MKPIIAYIMLNPNREEGLEQIMCWHKEESELATCPTIMPPAMDVMLKRIKVEIREIK